ncbi:MAG: hypothetical protein SOW08_06595 [Lachnospiraceae bacterium]|nr:hypothetical protein [Lachnospiraceae bacterium]
MRKAGLHQLLLLCLCICLGLFSAGCSGQNSRKDSDSAGLEYQAEGEASDTGPVDSDGSTQQDEKIKSADEPVQNSAELFAEEETAIPVDMTVYNYDSMENVLAAMVSAMQDEEINRYYRDMCNNDLAVHYVYSYVNMFDEDTFEQMSMSGEKHDSYVRVDENYLDNLLVYAFGNAITTRNLEADGDLLLKKNEDYYVAVDDIRPVQVDYTGFENEAYTESTVFPFDYELYLDNGVTEDGIMQVRFQESDKAESGIILKNVAVTRY